MNDPKFSTQILGIVLVTAPPIRELARGQGHYVRVEGLVRRQVLLEADREKRERFSLGKSMLESFVIQA